MTSSRLHICKFADGRRTWNPELTAFQNFESAISTEISNRATGAENTYTIRTDENVIQIVRDGQLSPEEKVSYDLEVEKLINHLPASDMPAKEMAKRILVDEIKGMQELAVALGMDQNATDATKKRLRRHVLKYVEENPYSLFSRTPKKANPSTITIPPDAPGVATNDR